MVTRFPLIRLTAQQPDVYKGFSLLELMVVVLIISVLSVLALPAYSDYVRRSQAVEAVTTMADFRVKMEQYYLDNRNYGTGATCGVANPTGKYFSYSCSISDAQQQAYLLRATGITGSVSGSKLHRYTINQANQKTTEKFNGADSTKSCWLIKTDADC